MKTYGAIYKITNEINGKSYVGQSISPSLRIRSHFQGKDYQSSPVLRKAMRKYGKANFSFRIIDIAQSKKELDDKEIYWINQVDALLPNGYNIREGGSRGLLSEESKKKISQANKGRLSGKNNPCYGRTGSKSPLYGKVGPNKGKKLSGGQKQLLSKRLTGIKRSLETKEKSRTAALSRWEYQRRQHLLEKGHNYDLVRLSSGTIRCRVCKNEAERRYRREKQRLEKKSDKKKARK